MLRLDRKNKGGGGCLIYYRENINVIPKPKFEVADLEAIWIEVIINSQRLLIGNVYRPPDDSDFHSRFKVALDKIWLRRNNILVIGDINSDLLKNDFKDGKKLQVIMNSLGLKNVIWKPTRIDHTSQTLIDVILTSDTSKILSSGAFNPAISDHKLVYVIVKLQRNREKPKIKTVRNYKNIDVKSFKTTLENTPWWVSNVFEDIDDVANSWEVIYKGIVEEFIIERKAKIRTNSLPWITTEIRKLLNKRYRLLKKWQKTKDHETRLKYNESRNLARKEMRKAETNYWKEEFQEATNSKDFWRTVKKVQKKRANNKIGPIEDDSGTIETRDTVKAELMNDFFPTIGEKLANELPDNQHTEEENYTTCPSEITTAPIIQDIKTDREFLQKQLKSIKPEKASGPDNIRPKDFKLAEESIIEGLDIVIQKSKQTRKMPSKWKTGEVKVAFKKGDPTQRTNYRPLTMLSLPSKIMEGQICKQIDEHIEKNNLSNDCQWGYKKGKSTETLLIKMTEDWKKAIDQGKVVGIIFLDFSKAFDSVSHPILMEKVKETGIKGALYDWICDYLTNRYQFTDINGIKSKIKIVEYGVPQGSLLGPRLFKIYVNDLPESTNDGVIYLFADDTTVYYIADHIEDVIDGLNRISKDLNKWCSQNKMTVNSDKTEAMIISLKPFIGPLRPLIFGDSNIKFVTTSKCLGVTIDNSLKWNVQVKNIVKSYGAKLSQIKRMKYLPKNVLVEIYYKSIIANVTYCITVWGTCSPPLFEALEHIHVRAAKLIYDIKDEKLTDEQILQKVGWRKLEYIYKRRILSVMYDIYYNKTPSTLTDMFSKGNNSTTKQRLNFQIKRPRTEQGRASLLYRGPLTWNLIPHEIKSNPSKETFKRKLRTCSQLNNINYRKEGRSWNK